MSTSRVGLDPQFAKKIAVFENMLAKHKIKVKLIWGYRSVAEQNKLYAIGRTKPGATVTDARGGYSWHNFGLAADYAFIIEGKVSWYGDWDKFGEVARQCGLEWGGDWKKRKDRPHVQVTRGKTLAQMRAAATIKAKK